MYFHSFMWVSQKLWDWNPWGWRLSERINRITKSIEKEYEMRKVARPQTLGNEAEIIIWNEYPSWKWLCNWLTHGDTAIQLTVLTGIMRAFAHLAVSAA